MQEGGAFQGTLRVQRHRQQAPHEARVIATKQNSTVLRSHILLLNLIGVQAAEAEARQGPPPGGFSSTGSYTNALSAASPECPGVPEAKAGGTKEEATDEDMGMPRPGVCPSQGEWGLPTGT